MPRQVSCEHDVLANPPNKPTIEPRPIPSEMNRQDRAKPPDDIVRIPNGQPSVLIFSYRAVPWNPSQSGSSIETRCKFKRDTHQTRPTPAFCSGKTRSSCPQCSITFLGKYASQSSTFQKNRSAHGRFLSETRQGHSINMCFFTAQTCKSGAHSTHFRLPLLRQNKQATHPLHPTRNLKQRHRRSKP